MGLKFHTSEQDATIVEQPSVLRRVLQGGLWVAGGRIVGVGLAFLINILLARTLSPGDFGTFVLIQSLIMFGSILGRCGTDVAIVRFVSEAMGSGDLGLARQAIRIGFRWAAIAILPVVAIGLCALSWYAIPPQSENREFLLLISGLLLVVLTFLFLSAESHRGFDEIFLATLFNAQVSGPLLNFLFLVLIAVQSFFVELSLIHVLGLYALSASVVLLLAQLCLVRTSKKYLGNNVSDEPQVKAYSVLSVGIPASISYLCVYALFQGAVWIAGVFCSQVELAEFSLAIRLMQFVSMISLIANVAVTPWISRLKSSGKIDEMQHILQRTASVAAIPSFCSCIVILFYSGEIIPFLFGQTYAGSADALAILAIGQIVVTGMGACGQILLHTGHHRLDMVCNFGGALSLFAVGPWVTENFGVVGLAATVTVTISATQLAKWILTKLFVGVWSHANFRSVFSIATVISSSLKMSQSSNA